jgi:hypothetical protein
MQGLCVLRVLHGGIIERPSPPLHAGQQRQHQDRLAFADLHETVLVIELPVRWVGNRPSMLRVPWWRRLADPGSSQHRPVPLAGGCQLSSGCAGLPETVEIFGARDSAVLQDFVAAILRKFCRTTGREIGGLPRQTEFKQTLCADINGNRAARSRALRGRRPRCAEERRDHAPGDVTAGVLRMPVRWHLQTPVFCLSTGRTAC